MNLAIRMGNTGNKRDNPNCFSSYQTGEDHFYLNHSQISNNPTGSLEF